MLRTSMAKYNKKLDDFICLFNFKISIDISQRHNSKINVRRLFNVPALWDFDYYGLKQAKKEMPVIQ